MPDLPVAQTVILVLAERERHGGSYGPWHVPCPELAQTLWAPGAVPIIRHMWRRSLDPNGPDYEVQMVGIEAKLTKVAEDA